MDAALPSDGVPFYGWYTTPLKIGQPVSTGGSAPQTATHGWPPYSQPIRGESPLSFRSCPGQTTYYLRRSTAKVPARIIGSPGRIIPIGHPAALLHLAGLRLEHFQLSGVRVSCRPALPSCTGVENTNKLSARRASFRLDWAAGLNGGRGAPTFVVYPPYLFLADRSSDAAWRTRREVHCALLC